MTGSLLPMTLFLNSSSSWTVNTSLLGDDVEMKRDETALVCAAAAEGPTRESKLKHLDDNILECVQMSGDVVRDRNVKNRSQHGSSSQRAQR